MAPPPNRRPSPAEFRTRAVELARSSSLEPAQVARHRGIDRDTLRRWLRQAEAEAGERAGLRTDERAELLRLRREDALLNEERESLRKATQLFAREGATR